MLPVEDAYERYRAGEISYEEYRRLHADPDDQVRLARVRMIKPERPEQPAYESSETIHSH